MWQREKESATGTASAMLRTPANHRTKLRPAFFWTLCAIRQDGDLTISDANLVVVETVGALL